MTIFLTSGDRPRGKLQVSAKVPDTLTSWVVSAVSLNPNFGLGLLDSYPSFTVFMPFFIQLNLPYSVKRGETLTLEILLHNYLATDLQAETTFYKSDTEFDVAYSVGWTGRVFENLDLI